MKIQEGFLARLRDLARNASASASAQASAAHIKNVMDSLHATAANTTASAKTGQGAPLATPPLPAFVTDLLNQLGVAVPGVTSPTSTPTSTPTSDASPVPDTQSSPRAEPGQFVTRSFRCAAGTRDYKLYIPKSYTGKPMPLLLMLHGCTQSPDDFAAGTRANALAEELGYIVAYPAQTSAANSQRCWNWFEPAHQSPELGEPAILAGITRQIVADYAIDEARVFVAGLSAGGAMAAIMGTAYPELFAAVCVHSGLPVGVASDLNSALAAMRDGGKRSGIAAHSSTEDAPLPAPMIIFHGDQDKTVHPRNAEALLTQCIAGRLSQTIEEEGKSTGVRAVGRTYTRTLVIDGEGDSLAELWLIHNAAHAWAGGDATGSYTDPKGPDATREMLKFFLAHPKHTSLMQRIGDSFTFLRDS